MSGVMMDTLLLLEEDVKKLVSMDEAISAVESAFREKALGNVRCRQRSTSSTEVET
jgi:ornithine cyclodeaminase/alanine dehydrogenase-like protein (mu-crystallin family)